MESFFQVVGVIFAMVIIVIAAYYLTKFLSVKSKGLGGKTRCFRLIDRFSVSKDKMFVLIAVGNNVYLIGITGQNMTVVDQLDLAEMNFKDDSSGKPTSVFADILSGLKNNVLKTSAGIDINKDGQALSGFLRTKLK